MIKNTLLFLLVYAECSQIAFCNELEPMVALDEIHQFTGEDYNASTDELLANDYYQIKAGSIAFDSSLGRMEVVSLSLKNNIML